jgi:hypothetical protein
MNKRTYLIKIGILFFVMSFSCATSENYLLNNPDGKACILYYESNYKIEIMKNLASKLNNYNISVYTDTFDKKDQYNPENYNAVILLSGAFISNPLPLAADYIKKNNYAGNIIYFCTTKNDAYGYLIDKNKIDAITSASSKNIDNAKEQINEIIQKVLKLSKK